MTTTCQICGRAIKANTGLIAHHGYKRPGQGWQTASCFGAKYRPYEVACDAIPEAIAAAERFRDHTMVQHLLLVYEPPAQLDVSRRDAYGSRRGEPRYVAIPANFDATKGSPGSYRPDTYESAFWPIVHKRQQELRNVNEYIAEMRKRLAAWKAPAKPERMVISYTDPLPRGSYY
jgi:hypothetical protein